MYLSKWLYFKMYCQDFFTTQDEDIEQDEDELLLITNRVTGSETLFKPPSRLTFCKSPPQVIFVVIFNYNLIFMFIVIIIVIVIVIVIVIAIINNVHIGGEHALL